MPVTGTATAWVLHTRPYRDTSLLVDLFTLEHGLVRAVVRGARAGLRRGMVCQPFQPLQLVLSGRGQLRNATALEPDGPAARLAGRKLFAAMYLNELLLRLMHEDEPHEPVFRAYCEALAALGESVGLESALRPFEMVLLQELGYGLDFSADILGEPLSADKAYHYTAGHGFVPEARDTRRPVYPGAALLAIAAGDYGSELARRPAKSLCREALKPLLGPKPLASRALFVAEVHD